jgi:antitoxin component YwqK of YwqJK toxin-antitoxin module
MAVFAILSSCKPSETAPVAGTGDFTGYDLQEIPGSSIRRAVKNHASGQIAEEGYVLDDKRTGQWIKYNPDGQLASIENYVNGLLHGPYLKFANRGQVEQRINYSQGQMHGYWYQFKFGNKIEERQYNLGKLHGNVRTYDDKNWKLRSESAYQDGLQHGIYRYYDDEGKVSLEYEYKNGEKIRGGMVNKSE